MMRSVRLRIHLIAQELETCTSDDNERANLLLKRAMLLLHRRGGLGAALVDLDTVLQIREEDVDARKARAVILACLGADTLACNDLHMADNQTSVKAPPPPPPLLRAPVAFCQCASQWHMSRRIAMLHRYPEILTLYSSHANNRIQDVLITCALLWCCVMFDWLACYWSTSLVHTIMLSVTLGAVSAYGKQALTHELGHIDPRHPLAILSSRMASAHTLFPWSMYYWNYHPRHHAHTGDVLDRDGDILFQQWHLPPTKFRDSALGRLIWTAIFSITVYVQFCLAKAKLDAAHRPSVQHEGITALVFLAFTYMWGTRGMLYLILTSAFSLGAMGHPYIHFWMVQHWFVKNRTPSDQRIVDLTKEWGHVQLTQPTMSYLSHSNGIQAAIWHALHFGELRHVEHHDFPFIPYLRAYRLPQIAPEFYCNLEQSTSAFEALSQWLFSTNLVKWMRTEGDFAGRGKFLHDLRGLIARGELDENDDCAQANGRGDDDDDEVWYVEKATMVDDIVVEGW